MRQTSLSSGHLLCLTVTSLFVHYVTDKAICFALCRKNTTKRFHFLKQYKELSFLKIQTCLVTDNIVFGGKVSLPSDSMTLISKCYIDRNYVLFAFHCAPALTCPFRTRNVCVFCKLSHYYERNDVLRTGHQSNPATAYSD